MYVAANVLLLENNPERNLPLAYGVAALTMLAVGRVYAHFEHHWLLQKLVVRVLLAAVAIAGVLGVLVATGHSVVAAIAIMTGYRVVYMLTSLEFWGVSAVVFDVRQSKRLFGIISAGDMPAKAIGAPCWPSLFIATWSCRGCWARPSGLTWLALVALRATLELARGGRPRPRRRRARHGRG